MEQVMVRRQQLHGNQTNLVLANVLSEDGDTYRVKINGQATPVEVKKSDVLPVQTVHGQARVSPQTLLPTKSTGASYSLSQRLYR